MGDLDLTHREIAYDDLSSGLVDSYRVVGTGLGHTWRPPVGDGLPFGMLRIDMILVGPGLQPLRNQPDCAPRVSARCILDVTLAAP